MSDFQQSLDGWEQTAVDVVAKFAPWAAPLPTAFLVGRATLVHLAWPKWVAIVAAAIIECLGLATVSTALTLREYNKTRRRSDPSAPLPLAYSLAGLYFVTAVILTVALDTVPRLAVYSPGIFPVLSLAGAMTLAIRADHRRRLAAIANDKNERKAARQARKIARTSTEEPARPTAGIHDWREIVAQANGDLRDVDAKGVEAAIEAKGFAPPSRRTLQHWAREAQESATD